MLDRCQYYWSPERAASIRLTIGVEAAPSALTMNPFFNQYLAVEKGLADNTILAYRPTLKLLFCYTDVDAKSPFRFDFWNVPRASWSVLSGFASTDREACGTFCVDVYTADTLDKSVDDLYIDDLDEKRILSFLEHGESERNWTARTRNARLAGIPTWFRFIAREQPDLMLQCQQIRAISNKRTDHRVIEHLEEEEIKAWLDAPKAGDKNRLRDHALLLLLSSLDQNEERWPAQFSKTTMRRGCST